VTERRHCVWQYDRGEWVGIADPRTWPEESGVPSQEYAAWMRSYGYEHVRGSELDCIDDSDLWALDRDGTATWPWEFLYEWDMGSHWRVLVFLTDFPSLVMFQQFVNTGTLDALREHLWAAQRTLDKLFYVQHGHYSDQACDRCDPVQASAERVLKRRREETAT